MYTVGADTIRIESGVAVPAGATHATDYAGITLCRGVKTRFHFPAHSWAFDADIHLCPMCAAVALERGTPHQPVVDTPVVGTAAVETAVVEPAAVEAALVEQPAPIDWSASTELVAWSGDL